MHAHHLAWLQAHPDRSPEWLAGKLADGFDVHHLDGDHANNAGGNLVLIEHADHMRLHGMTGPGRLAPPKRGPRGPETSPRKSTLLKRIRLLEAQLAPQPEPVDPHAHLRSGGITWEQPGIFR